MENQSETASAPKVPNTPINQNPVPIPEVVQKLIQEMSPRTEPVPTHTDQFHDLNKLLPKAVDTGQGNQEYFAPIHPTETPGQYRIGDIKEGWINGGELNPESKDQIGTIHTHRNHIPFSFTDIRTFMLRDKEAFMGTVDPDGNVNLLTRTPDFAAKFTLPVVFGLFAEAAALKVKHALLKSDSKTQIRDIVGWTLKACDKTGITFSRGRMGGSFNSGRK